MRPTITQAALHERLLGAALLWLLAGAVLLLTTLVPAHTDVLGWTPAFWLICAPMVVLLALEPSLPRQLLALLGTRRRRSRPLAWH
jgi:hypothetical protein